MSGIFLEFFLNLPLLPHERFNIRNIPVFAIYNIHNSLTIEFTEIARDNKRKTKAHKCYEMLAFHVLTNCFFNIGI